MKQLSIFLAIGGWTCIAFFPAATRADETLEDLDVTMVVVDSPGDLDDLVSEMRGPDAGGVDDDDWDDEEGDESDDAADEESEDEMEDGFEDDDDGFSSDEVDEDDAMEDEDDFEEGEDVDDDVFDDEGGDDTGEDGDDDE